MDEQNVERLITATCRRLSTKIGNDLQTVHDTLTAEIRRALTGLASALRKEFEENAKPKSSNPPAPPLVDSNSDKKG